MKTFIEENKTKPVYLFPLLLFLGYFLWQSLAFPLHDFSNSYFPAHIVANTNNPETILFDIYIYNSYIWDLGYKEVLGDFYLNSPFNAVVFYPFLFLEDAYLAKLIFNSLSCVLFVLALYVLVKKNGKKTFLLLIIIPFLFYVPIKNQILFGQTYFLIFALVTFGFLWLEKQKTFKGVFALLISVLLKVFPVGYGVVLVFQSQWKVILYAIIGGLVVLGLSIWFTGLDLWSTYVFEVLPNAIKNKSTVNFQFNAQSVEVFLKTLFIRDAYYNPDALFDNERLYILIKWLWKAVVLGIAITLSFSNKKQLFKLLVIWVIALFLIQSRTATYAQILWIIPAFFMWNSEAKIIKKIFFFGVLFSVCNIPLAALEELPIFFKFTRLWLTIILAGLVYSSLLQKLTFKPILWCLVFLLPLHLDLFSSSKHSDTSTYVLEPQPYFMIYDFKNENKKLVVKALGREGDITKNTSILLNTFNETICKIEANQIIYNGKPITNTAALKKKPVLVNDCEIYYLTDANSRRGAYTLKKINICNSKL